MSSHLLVLSRLFLVHFFCCCCCCHSVVNMFIVTSFRGEVLKLTKIGRNEMGSYLCIASNSVPPSVSKRIALNIHCEYENDTFFCLGYGCAGGDMHKCECLCHLCCFGHQKFVNSSKLKFYTIA